MRVLVVGFGSVGRALVSLLEARREDLYARTGLLPRVVGVIDSQGAAISARGLAAAELLEAKRSGGTVAGVASCGMPLSASGASGDQAMVRLIRDTAADVLIECGPSVLSNPQPAFERLKAAMGSAKHAISVNKAPLAVAMPALLDLAKFNRVQLRYSGTVGAGTPVLATARTLAAGDTIEKIRGILNGTTNFILHKMTETGQSYHDALGEAMRLGYAETDPSTDVDGVDTATKVVILANAVLRMNATVKDVSIEGIRDIAQSRIQAAIAAGKALKLIGEIDASTRTLRVSVQEVLRHGPMDVPANLNAVQFTLSAAGETTLVGRGAGGPETATAIVRDLVDIWHSSGG